MKLPSGSDYRIQNTLGPASIGGNDGGYTALAQAYANRSRMQTSPLSALADGIQIATSGINMYNQLKLSKQQEQLNADANVLQQAKNEIFKAAAAEGRSVSYEEIQEAMSATYDELTGRDFTHFIDEDYYEKLDQYYTDFEESVMAESWQANVNVSDEIMIRKFSQYQTDDTMTFADFSEQLNSAPMSVSLKRDLLDQARPVAVMRVVPIAAETAFGEGYMQTITTKEEIDELTQFLIESQEDIKTVAFADAGIVDEDDYTEHIRATVMLAAKNNVLGKLQEYEQAMIDYNGQYRYEKDNEDSGRANQLAANLLAQFNSANNFVDGRYTDADVVKKLEDLRTLVEGPMSEGNTPQVTANAYTIQAGNVTQKLLNESLSQYEIQGNLSEFAQVTTELGKIFANTDQDISIELPSLTNGTSPVTVRSFTDIMQYEASLVNIVSEIHPTAAIISPANPDMPVRLDLLTEDISRNFSGPIGISEEIDKKELSNEDRDYAEGLIKSAGLRVNTTAYHALGMALSETEEFKLIYQENINARKNEDGYTVFTRNDNMDIWRLSLQQMAHQIENGNAGVVFMNRTPEDVERMRGRLPDIIEASGIDTRSVQNLAEELTKTNHLQVSGNSIILNSGSSIFGRVDEGRTGQLAPLLMFGVNSQTMLSGDAGRALEATGEKQATERLYNTIVMENFPSAIKNRFAGEFNEEGRYVIVDKQNGDTVIAEMNFSSDKADEWSLANFYETWENKTNGGGEFRRPERIQVNINGVRIYTTELQEVYASEGNSFGRVSIGGLAVTGDRDIRYDDLQAYLEGIITAFPTVLPSQRGMSQADRDQSGTIPSQMME